MLSRRGSRGFTIVELLVGIGLMAILTMVALPTFSTWLQNVQIRTAADAMQNGAQMARAEAVRRNTSVLFQLTSTTDNSCALSTTGTNWVISLDSAASNCGAAPSADAATPTTPRIIQVRSSNDGSKNATVSADRSSITFNGLGRLTTATGMTITISNPSGGACVTGGGPMRCMRVTVSTTGQVRMCSPDALPGSVQGCS